MMRDFNWLEMSLEQMQVTLWMSGFPIIGSIWAKTECHLGEQMKREAPADQARWPSKFSPSLGLPSLLYSSSSELYFHFILFVLGNTYMMNTVICFSAFFSPSRHPRTAATQFWWDQSHTQHTQGGPGLPQPVRMTPSLATVMGCWVDGNGRLRQSGSVFTGFGSGVGIGAQQDKPECSPGLFCDGYGKDCSLSWWAWLRKHTSGATYALGALPISPAPFPIASSCLFLAWAFFWLLEFSLPAPGVVGVTPIHGSTWLPKTQWDYTLVFQR